MNYVLTKRKNLEIFIKIFKQILHMVFGYFAYALMGSAIYLKKRSVNCEKTKKMTMPLKIRTDLYIMDIILYQKG